MAPLPAGASAYIAAVVSTRTYAVPAAILLVGWLLVIAYAYPGQMTQDSFDQLTEARAGIYSDSHPPVMAALWRVVETFVAGPLGMLVLQVSTFQLGLYLIFRRTFARCGAAIAASGLLVFPPVMLPMAVIWKDCLMAGFLALGFGALLSSRRSVRIGALGSLMLATAFRYNAFAATLPLVVLLFEWRPGLHWIRRHVIAVATR